MYCRLCDIEYPNSLRFCKWCGGGLVAREAVANQHCPSCASEIEREWVFCNECGVDLATLGAQPRDVTCPACSATVRKGWMFCRQCGEQVATERAAESCPGCSAGVRGSWTFCKQCATRLKDDPVDGRGHFRTVAGIPALPPEDLEAAPFSNLHSGELPPLEDVIKSDNRRNGGAVVPPPNARGGNEAPSGTHPLTSSRPTGHLDPDALDREIRTNRGDAPAAFGRLEAAELIQPQPPVRSNGGEATRAYSPIAEPPSAWDTAPDEALPASGPFVDPNGSSGLPAAASFGSAPPDPNVPASDSTQAFASPFAPPPEQSISFAPPPEPVAPFVPPPPPPPPVAPVVTEILPRVDTAPPMPAPTGGYPAPAPPSWGQSGYVAEQQPQQPFVPAPPPVQPFPTGPQPSYDRAPTVALPPESPGVFPPARPAAKSGSPVKWIALGLVLLAVLAAGGVGSVFAYRWWKARTVVVETPPVPQPQPPTPTPTPEPPPTAAVPDGMVLVQGASFGLGTNDATADEYSIPQHDVTVKTFYLDLNEVTNAQYKAFVDAKGHAPPKEGWVNGAPKPGTENWPVVYVSWQDAVAYAEWAGKRLPTESEWELAARGTDGRKYPWGNDWDPKKGNLGKEGDAGTPEPVGSHPSGKSPGGALDMLGNVWEWTASPFTIYPGGKASLPAGGDFKVIRGGAFDNNGKTTVTYRGYFLPNSAWPKVGFRCAKDES